MTADERIKRPDREKVIDLAISTIEKQFGRGSIMRLKDTDVINRNIPVIPTGLLSLDVALGTGGLPRGRVVEVFGPESSGKTTLTLHLIAECQKDQGVAVFVDAEHALDLKYAARLGVKVEDLLLSQPNYGEEALDIVETLVRSGAVDLIVIDSVAALVPKAEIDGEMGDSHMGLQARLMSQALRKLTAAISRSNTLVVFINQIRMQLGVTYGNPETTTGGRALKFYSSVRLDIRKVGTIKSGEDIVGARTRVKVVKNKLAPPHREVEFDILFNEGISKEGDILDIAASLGIVEKSGTWYSYKGERLGQGRDNVRLLLREHRDILTDIEKRVKDSYGLVALQEDRQEKIEKERKK